METVSIRDLRGADLRERAREGKPLAITNRGALIGVIIPASSAWVEHLVFYNWPRVHQSIAEGEQAIADDPAVPASDGDGERPDGGAGRPVVPLDAMVVGETVAQSPASVDAVSQLRAPADHKASGSGRIAPRPAQASLDTGFIPLPRDPTLFGLPAGEYVPG